MDYVSVVLSIFFVEFIVDYLVLKIFKIHYNLIYLLFLQIPKICASVLCLIYYDIIWLCCLTKILSKFICVVFITDSFKPKRLVSLICLEMMIVFSLGGFLEFLLLCIDSTIKELFCVKIDKSYQFLVIFLILLYIFAFFKIVRSLEKNKFLKSFSANVSFCVFGKHINLYGLIDSGNSLSDPLTRLPVVLICEGSLKKFLTAKELDLLFGTRCRKICCDTVSGEIIKLPICNVSKIILRQGKIVKKHRCMIGLVSRKLENGKFDCLLHRDFL